MSEVSELSLFLSWTMLKSANLEKSVLAPWPMSRADLRDSRSRTSSNFFLTSGPPFWKRKQITFYNSENSSNDSIIIRFRARFLKIEGKKTRQITTSSRADLHDSRSRTSSNFFLTSGPPFWKRKQITFYNLENSANDSIIIKFPARFLKIEGKKNSSNHIIESSRFFWLWGQCSRKKFRFIYYV